MLSTRTTSHRLLSATFLSGLGLTLGLALPLGTAHAADSASAGGDTTRWGLGLAVGVKRSPYREVGTDTNVIPLVNLENRYVRLFGTTLDAKLPSVGAFDFSLRAKYGMDGYKSSDSGYLDGMDKRKGGMFVGFATKWRSPVVDVSFEWLHAAGHGNGNRMKLGVERDFGLSDRLKLTPYAAIEHMNSRDVDYYFGVRDSEVRSDRAAYDGRSTFNLEGGVRLNYALATNQNIFLDMGVQRWGSGVTDSPLVSHSTNPAVRLGYLYRF